MWLLSIAQVLTMVAAGNTPDAAQSAVAALPDPISTRQTYFAIPFEIDQIEHPTLGAAEIQLYVSRDRGVTWQHSTSVTPKTKHFLFRASGDGEYWFAVRTRDRAGNHRPPIVRDPGLRVLVDTQVPELSLQAQRDPTGRIVAKWQVNEPHINPDSLIIQYRTGDSHAWHSVEVDPATLKPDAATSSGEVAWWPPAGQGRIEIRAEVKDAAGNPNACHAQVMSIAGTAPPADSMVSAPTTTPPDPSNDWQPAPTQQQPTYPPYTPPAQTPSPTNNNTPAPWEQYQGSSTSVANEPAPTGPYAPSTSPYQGNQADPNRRSSHQGATGSEYDTGRQLANTPTATHSQQAQADRYGPPRPSGPTAQPAPTYGPYAQNRDTQQPGEGTSAPAQNSWSPNQPKSPPTTGTVTAEPSPSYRSQYTPPAPTRQKKPQSQPRVVNSRLFEVEYTDPDQPMTVGRVELWGTRDGGVTWQSYGFDSDSRSPMLAQVPDAGKYGFTVVFHPSYGQSAQLPQRGQKPDLHIEVDLTRPDAQLQGVDRPSDGSNALDIRWRATDSRLGQKPVSLFYADALAGQWRPIAKGIENTGRYRWKLPRNLPDKINIRIDVIDAAGNTTTAETRTPVLVVKSQPSRQPAPASTDVRAKDVRPMSQPQQATPYNFGYGYGQ